MECGVLSIHSHHWDWWFTRLRWRWNGSLVLKHICPRTHTSSWSISLLPEHIVLKHISPRTRHLEAYLSRNTSSWGISVPEHIVLKHICPRTHRLEAYLSQNTSYLSISVPEYNFLKHISLGFFLACLFQNPECSKSLKSKKYIWLWYILLYYQAW